MVELLKKGRNPGEWWGMRTQNGQRTATVVCPSCKEWFSLDGHSIYSDGTVLPSVVCPNRCGFHAHIRLVGWNKGEQNTDTPLSQDKAVTGTLAVANAEAGHNKRSAGECNSPKPSVASAERGCR